MNTLPILQTGTLIVFHGPHAASHESMRLIAELALRGAVTVLDGGNRYKPNLLAVMMGRMVLDPTPAAKRIFNRRAFTCYEMNTLLCSTPPLRQPCVILDLLSTFHDDHTPLYEAARLLRSCLNQIARLLVSAPVIVTLAPPLTEERAFLLEEVYERADQTFTFEDNETETPAHQAALF